MTAGASMIHFHARDDDGAPAHAYERYRDSIRAIREASRLIVHSTLGQITIKGDEARVAQRKDPTTVAGKAFSDLQHIIATRKRLAHLHASVPVHIGEVDDPRPERRCLVGEGDVPPDGPPGDRDLAVLAVPGVDVVAEHDVLHEPPRVLRRLLHDLTVLTRHIL